MTIADTKPIPDSTPAKVAPAMADVGPWPRVFSWDVESYHAVAERGVFHGRNVELIRGEIVEMSPQDELHFQVIMLLQDYLRKTFGDGFYVRPQGPVRLSEISEPEPDVAVVTGTIRDYVKHPESSLLAVEVSRSSLKFDRVTKMALYAEHGIPEYWVVNVPGRTIDVFRDPFTDESGDEVQHRYAYHVVLKAEDEIAPAQRPDHPIKVAELLPTE